MAAYPHMIFATEDAGLSKDRLVELLTACFPGEELGIEQTALKVAVTRAGYPFTFWFEDADRVGEMYVGFLPDGARRRPIINAATVVDMSGAADGATAQEDAARVIVGTLAAQDGVWVFSEEAKRFVGLDYGDGVEELPVATAPVTPEAVVVEPEPVVVEPEPVAVEPPAEPEPVIVEPIVVEPQVEPEPAIVETVVEPEPEAFPTVEPPATPEPTHTPEPEATPEPPAPEPIDAPAPIEQPAPITEPDPIPAPEPAPESGFLKRLFGRRR